MAIQCSDIIKVAANLVQEPGEPEQRSAVSRYYYGSLHRCKDWLVSLPGAPSGGGQPGGEHQYVLNQLRQLDPQCSKEQKDRGRRIAILLGALKLRRVTADYKLSDDLPAKEVELHVVQSDSIFEECAK